MRRANYDAMSNAKLKQYFVKLRGDRSALQLSKAIVSIMRWQLR